ncbi:PRKR-interacting protein 1 isoform X2 [Bombina bombina]|uniref:PRKR-interacting protein 1 isoform X2 n=1 Tax=Bombina bombina TaxID=8345 RepID=UPI00235AD100|nr:PRKR-interacting protein 1 isoform X2 [Bombina bombina]
MEKEKGGVSKDVRPKKEPQPLVIPKNATDEQRLKLERLMRNPDKVAPIPDRLKEWTPRSAPEFVRDVMGSSAGAGSGEFHVYRHLRRREYQRQEFMDLMSDKQKLDVEFQRKLKENQMKSEERTAKRRLKRQKLKEKQKMAKKPKAGEKHTEPESPPTPESSDGDQSDSEDRK